MDYHAENNAAILAVVEDRQETLEGTAEAAAAATVAAATTTTPSAQAISYHRLQPLRGLH